MTDAASTLPFVTKKVEGVSSASLEAIAREDRYGAHNYASLPVVLSRGSGCYVYDVDGVEYLDFLSAYSAVSQGHCHPKIVKAVNDQLHRLTLASRAFYTDRLGHAEEYITKLFQYDKVLFMNSGAEAVETGMKLARRWGYDVKKVPENEALIIVANNNFHGRTTGILSFSTDPATKGHYGPYLPGFLHVPYNDVDSLREVLKAHSASVVGYLVEPIQGEAGVIVPDEGYLKQCADLCKEHNVLLIADEIQTGLGRCGTLLASHYDKVRPDIVLLGKALSGGILPVSAVLADDPIMLTIKPGQHGSTFGGSPLACSAVEAAMKVILEEDLANRAKVMGEKLLNKLAQIQAKRTDIVTQVRGRGLLTAMEFVNRGDLAYKICLQLKDRGLLAKQTHGNIVRFAPPLVLTESQLEKACSIIESVVLQQAS